MFRQMGFKTSYERAKQSHKVNLARLWGFKAFSHVVGIRLMYMLRLICGLVSIQTIQLVYKQTS